MDGKWGKRGSYKRGAARYVDVRGAGAATAAVSVQSTSAVAAGALIYRFKTMK